MTKIRAKISRQKTMQERENQWSQKLVLWKDPLRWQTPGETDREKKREVTNKQRGMCQIGSLLAGSGEERMKEVQTPVEPRVGEAESRSAQLSYPRSHHITPLTLGPSSRTSATYDRIPESPSPAHHCPHQERACQCPSPSCPPTTLLPFTAPHKSLIGSAWS